MNDFDDRLSMSEIDGIIFDCDGTLADTMPAHYEAWAAVLERYELAMSEDRFYELGGWPTLRVAELLARESGRTIDLQRLADEKESLFHESLHEVRPIEPVVRVVREFQGRLPLAVATGAVRSVCERILDHIGLAAVFETIVSSEDVEHHKPSPDIFLEAARRLGVAPARCRVYEDSDPGIEAARRAGMEYIDVRDFYTPRRVT
ncbi:MAG TPA: beta-phosphoglucomutase family hydrolase [Pirellulales bacterium]|nr:beta-phosphoglucomutase family hydrolase [Pirellulales bacterium]